MHNYNYKLYIIFIISIGNFWGITQETIRNWNGRKPINGKSLQRNPILPRNDQRNSHPNQKKTPQLTLIQISRKTTNPTTNR